MKKLRVASEFGFALLVISLLVACRGSKDGTEEGSTVSLPATTGLLRSIAISPATSSVSACVPAQFAATGYYSDGTSRNVTTLVFWQVDATTSNVAIANPLSGQIVGVTSGSAIVTAWTGGGVSASAVLNITAGNTLNSITVTPASATISTAATQTYAASAVCSNATLDVSAFNIWSSGNTGAATISTSGVATAIAAGSAVITATAGTVAASSVLNVP